MVGWWTWARATTAPQKLPIVLCSISLSCHAAFLSNVFVNIVKLICLDLWHVVPEPTTPAKPLNCISRLFNEQLSPPKMPRTIPTNIWSLDANLEDNWSCGDCHQVPSQVQVDKIDRLLWEERVRVLKRTSEFIGEACGALCPSFNQLLFAEQSLRSWERITCCKSDLSQTDLLKRFPKATLKRTRHVCIWHLVEWLYWVHLKESDKFSHVMLMPIGAENVWPKYQNEGKEARYWFGCIKLWRRLRNTGYSVLYGFLIKTMLFCRVGLLASKVSSVVAFSRGRIVRMATTYHFVLDAAGVARRPTLYLQVQRPQQAFTRDNRGNEIRQEENDTEVQPRPTLERVDFLVWASREEAGVLNRQPAKLLKPWGG